MLLKKRNRVLAMMTSAALACSMALTPVAVFAEYTDTVDAIQYGDYSIPAYDGDIAEEINGNEPVFTDENGQPIYGSGEIEPVAQESYGALDSLKRCTTCYAVLNQSLMPTYKRGDISGIKPTGWINNQYDGSLVSGGWIYNRCHLIGFQLTGIDNETSNPKRQYVKQDLITGTRALNVGSGSDGMVGYESETADYLRASEDNYMAYRVTPVFEGDNLVASGVLMEGLSLESSAEDGDFAAEPEVEFCAFVYNVQPGIEIDYATGENRIAMAEAEFSLNDCTAKISQDRYVYTGKQIRPAVTVKDGSKVLQENVDYTLKYGSNKYLGTATVNVAGAGNYKDAIPLTFEIIPKSTYITSLSRGTKKFTVKWRKQTVQTSGYQIQYATNAEFDGAKKVTVRSRTTTKKTVKNLKKKKTYYVRVRTYKSGGHYSSWSKVKTVKTR